MKASSTVVTLTACSALIAGVIATLPFPTPTVLADNAPPGRQVAIHDTENALRESRGKGRHDPLVGSWYVRVTTPDGGGWPVLITFVPGGGLVLSYDNTGPLPWLAPSAHGTWIRTARNKYLFTDIGWITDRNTGELVFEYEIANEIELNDAGDAFTGRVDYGATTAGRKIAIKPMP